jgi:hypothetical protein
MFRQAGVMTQQGEAAVQQQMVLGTSQPQRYPVDEIVEPRTAMLQVPWGRTGKKKDVAHATVQPPNPKARYHGRPIPPEYAVVEVMWTHDHHDDDELDFPNEEGDMTLGRVLGTRVLWNKANIVLDMLKPASKPSQPSSSPPGGPSDDDDDNSGDGNGDDGSHGSTPARSPRPDTRHKKVQGVNQATKHRLHA